MRAALSATLVVQANAATAKRSAGPAAGYLCRTLQRSPPTSICRSASYSSSSIARSEDSQFVGPLPSLLSWLQQAMHTATRVQQACEQSGGLMQVQIHSQALQVAIHATQARSRTAWPNPSVKRSANGVPPGPRYSAGVHYLQRGPGVTPSSPAYLKR